MKPMQPLNVPTLISMWATICMLILSGSNCKTKPVAKKTYEWSHDICKNDVPGDSLLPGTGEEG